MPQQLSKRAWAVIGATAIGVAAVLVTVVVAGGSGDADQRDHSTTSSMVPSTSTSSTAKASSTTASADVPTSTTASPNGPTTTVAAGPTSTTSRPSAPTTTLARPELEAAYRDGYTTQCRFIWSRAPKQVMYDPDDGAGQEWTYSDCTSMLMTLHVSGDATTPAAARVEGRSDAISEVSEFSISGVLCWIDPVSEAFVGCWDPATPNTFTGPPKG